MTDTAAARLRRILAFLPHIADNTTHRIEDVLAETGIDRETLFGDLVALTERYDVTGSFDQGVQVVLDEHPVSMFAPRFRRPPRITASELAALALGLSVLRRERPPDEWSVIDRALERLRGAGGTSQSVLDVAPCRAHAAQSAARGVVRGRWLRASRRRSRFRSRSR